MIGIQTENNLSETGALDDKTIDALQAKVFNLVKANDVAYAKAIETLQK